MVHEFLRTDGIHAPCQAVRQDVELRVEPHRWAHCVARVHHRRVDHVDVGILEWIQDQLGQSREGNETLAQLDGDPAPALPSPGSSSQEYLPVS